MSVCRHDAVFHSSHGSNYSSAPSLQPASPWLGSTLFPSATTSSRGHWPVSVYVSLYVLKNCYTTKQWPGLLKCFMTSFPLYQSRDPIPLDSRDKRSSLLLRLSFKLLCSSCRLSPQLPASDWLLLLQVKREFFLPTVAVCCSGGVVWLSRFSLFDVGFLTCHIWGELVVYN